MAGPCKACGGRGEWREQSRQKFRTFNSQTKKWEETWGDVWIDKRCSRCAGTGAL